MPTDARALGKTFDITNALSIVDLNGGANTGLLVNMKNAEVCTFVFVAKAGTAGADLLFTLQESDKLSGGTSQNLAIVTDWFKKEAATLTGAETWTRVSQSAAATVTVTDTAAATQEIYVLEVLATQLSDGFKYLSLNMGAATQAKIGGIIAILSDLKVQRKPENLAGLAV
jgi:hypothetical protein